jgi:hypothetical protein
MSLPTPMGEFLAGAFVSMVTRGRQNKHAGHDPPSEAGSKPLHRARARSAPSRVLPALQSVRGQPKIPPAVQTMLERGLVEIRNTNQWPRAFFTEAGMAALRQLVMDKRAMDPERFAHLRAELGVPIENE